MRNKKVVPKDAKAIEQEIIDSDVKKFLENGGSIVVVAPGATQDRKTTDLFRDRKSAPI